MSTVPLRYFAASNGENGFHSFYPEVFDDALSRVVILKGGPGTGKSSLMRQAARRAASHGYAVEEIRCSSDPDSLDGILGRTAQDSFAMLDGTAPHVTEMTLPGARDALLNLGEFWSETQLRAQRADIAAQVQQRAALYRRLYGYLSAAGQCTRNMSEAARGYLNPDKLRAWVTRLLGSYPAGQGYARRVMVTCSIGMKGICRFPTFEQSAARTVCIRDWGQTAYLLHEELLRQAQQRRMRVWVSYDPLIPQRPDGVFLPDCHLAVITRNPAAVTDGEDGCALARTLSMRRFATADGCRAAQPAIAPARCCRDRLLRAACATLDDIRKVHFSLEAQYAAAMDFDRLQRFTEQYLSRFFNEKQT